MSGHVVFLSGPIGVGKSTLGRELAGRLSGVFLDGDDFKQSSRPWYSSILQTSRGIVQAGITAVEHSGLAVVAYPLRQTDWVFFKRSFEDRGLRTVFVILRATYTSIVAEGRGRVFTDREQDRIRIMIAEGYCARSFGDLIVDTDRADFVETSALLEHDVRQIIDQTTLKCTHCSAP